jgi:hypothetical protein
MADETSFEAFADSDTDEWRIEWDDGTSRTTTLAAIAWVASDDPEATVVPL